jgi:hypothetical protein
MRVISRTVSYFTELRTSSSSTSKNKKNKVSRGQHLNSLTLDITHDAIVRSQGQRRSRDRVGTFHHGEQTEWQWPLSGVHSSMRVEGALPPLSLYLPSQAKLWCMLQLRGHIPEYTQSSKAHFLAYIDGKISPAW